MASITISENRAWVVAGWAFRQFLEDLRAMSVDPEVLEEIDSAEVLGFLSIKDADPTVRSRMIAALSGVTSSILSGLAVSTITAKPELRDVTQEYALGLQELQELLGSLKDG
ncbi:MAG: hypothetical protein U5J83_05770 [Bryobacterales bacterium]|nr:hypothetical protein [Bryobacterales bacterium]